MLRNITLAVLVLGLSTAACSGEDPKIKGCEELVAAMTAMRADADAKTDNEAKKQAYLDGIAKLKAVEVTGAVTQAKDGLVAVYEEAAALQEGDDGEAVKQKIVTAADALGKACTP